MDALERFLAGVDGLFDWHVRESSRAGKGAQRLDKQAIVDLPRRLARHHKRFARMNTGKTAEGVVTIIICIIGSRDA